MAVGVGASGFVGFAPETVPGTYVAPTVFSLLNNENLQYMEGDRIVRRPLRGIADAAGVLPGNAHIEGNIEIEVTVDEIVNWLRFARGAIVKSGTGPFVYTFTPNHLATPADTCSITVVRNGVAFGYVGCVVGSMQYSISNGLLVCTLGILGQDEADESVPTPTYNTQTPFATGQYTLEIPTTTQVFDADTFELSINDNPDPQYRIKDSRGAQFVKYGERNVTMSIQRDFESRTDYDAYKALTAQGITLVAEKAADDKIEFLVPAAIKESYEIQGLSGQADLIRANISYQGTYHAGSSKAYEIEVTSATDITLT